MVVWTYHSLAANIADYYISAVVFMFSILSWDLGVPNTSELKTCKSWNTKEVITRIVDQT